MKIKVNDSVLVVAGKYKGKTGRVMRVHEDSKRITVEGINIRTRHIPKTASRPGQRVTYEAPFDASNTMVLCPKTNKPTRVGYKILENGKKCRVAKRSGEQLDQAFKKASPKKKEK